MSAAHGGTEGAGMEPTLEEHEVLRDCATHVSAAECEVRNALQAALSGWEPGWVLERLGRLARELSELHEIVVIRLDRDPPDDPAPGPGETGGG